MSQYASLPPNELARKCSTDKDKKSFEPPMNTDEHRLKADKEKYIVKNDFDNRQCSDLIWSVTSQAWAAVGANSCALSRKIWDETVDSPFAVKAASLKLFRNQGDKFFILLISLSVFISVHRWLKIFCFNLLNLYLSVCAFAGVSDAFVGW